MNAWDTNARVDTDTQWSERQAQSDSHEKLMHRLDEFLSEFPEPVLDGDESPKVEELVTMLDPNSFMARSGGAPRVGFLPRERSNAIVPRVIEVTMHRGA